MLGQPPAGRGIALLGALAQREQGLVAAGPGSGPGDVQHLLGRQEGRLQSGRGLGEGAVVTTVTAQLGEGDEDLGGVGDARPPGGVPHRGGPGQELVEGGVEENVEQVGGHGAKA